MSAKRKRASKPVAGTLPPTITVDRAWLQERIDWLDVNHFATKLIREVGELAGSHSEAFLEQARTGTCSQQAADTFRHWGFEAEHCVIEELRKILESIEHVVEDLREVVYPKPAVTP